MFIAGFIFFQVRAECRNGRLASQALNVVSQPGVGRPSRQEWRHLVVKSQ
jgi:hypothetical protein